MPEDLTPDERVERLAEAEQQRILVFMLEAQADLEAKMGQAEATGANGTAAILSAIQSQIQGQLDAIQQGARTWADQAVRSVYQGSLTLADANLKDALGVDFDMSVGYDAPIHLEAMQLLSDAAYTPFEDYTGKIGRRVGDRLRELQLQATRANVLGIDTRASAERKLRQSLKAEGYTSFTDSSGRQWDLKRYTEMVSRTVIREAETQGTVNRLSQMGCELGIISRHNTVSKRAAAKGSSQTACDRCGRWEDKVVSLGGGTKGPDGQTYPSVEDARMGGVWHPNCRHNVLPYVEDIEDTIARLEDELGLPRTGKQQKGVDPTPKPKPAGKLSVEDDEAARIKAIQDEAQKVRDGLADAGDFAKQQQELDKAKSRLPRAAEELEEGERQLAARRAKLDDFKARKAAGDPDVYDSTIQRVQDEVDRWEGSVRGRKQTLDDLQAVVKAHGDERDVLEVEADSLKRKHKAVDQDLKQMEHDLKRLQRDLDEDNFYYQSHRDDAEAKVRELPAKIEAAKAERKALAGQKTAVAKQLDALPPRAPKQGGYEGLARQAQKVGSMIHDEADRLKGPATAKRKEAEAERDQANKDADDAKKKAEPEQKALAAHTAKRPPYPNTGPGSPKDWDEYRRLNDAWDAERQKLNKAYVDALDKAGLSQAQARAREAGERVRAAEKEEAASYFQVLKKLRPFGHDDPDSLDWLKTKPDARALAEQHALPFMPRTWIDSVAKLDYRVIGGRAYYDGSTMHINGSGRAALHETIHAVQRKHDGVTQLEIGFFNIRATGPDGNLGKIQSLRTLLPGQGYRSDEKARVGCNFPSTYMAKVYEYGGRLQPWEPKEVLPCTIDDLSRGTEGWLTDPAQRDLLDFTLGVLGSV